MLARTYSARTSRGTAAGSTDQASRSEPPWARPLLLLDEGRADEARAAAALRGARAEHAGAASGMLTLGPVARYLAEAQACAAAG
ncbi:hypothetical protein BU52_05730 [Streptomyces toyocaensis]|uniref:Uncharacterized protein n=1 Tax=Streptomyces toyocaensis TaxID=55952 RepID=A0A081XWK4_STRTO|nr:hypothetical protein [Streptomyces toyocaensis]KES07927.1 hypothetical protein BU52_05730 [Streptomyces toyocaensis]